MRIQIRRAAACLCLSQLATLPVHAQTIQKCVQPDGTVQYQQDACPAGTESRVFAVSASPAPASTLTIPPNSNHQYSTTLTANGVTVPGFIDTGATYVTVSIDTARRMHIGADNGRMGAMVTANGVIGSLTKKISNLKIGGLDLYDVDVAIVPNSPTLIGMSALSQLRFAVENGNMVLSKR